MKEKLTLILVLVLLSGSVLIFSLNGASGVKHKNLLTIGGVTLSVELADEDEEIIKGLSGEQPLADNQGMYFILPERQVTTFWMKNMLFPIDIIWVDNSKVVGVEKNSQPPSSRGVPSFTSPQPVTHVLEVNAGFTDKHGIEPGDKVELTN